VAARKWRESTRDRTVGTAIDSIARSIPSRRGTLPRVRVGILGALLATTGLDDLDRGGLHLTSLHASRDASGLPVVGRRDEHGLRRCGRLLACRDRRGSPCRRRRGRHVLGRSIPAAGLASSQGETEHQRGERHKRVATHPVSLVQVPQVCTRAFLQALGSAGATVSRSGAAVPRTRWTRRCRVPGSRSREPQRTQQVQEGGRAGQAWRKGRRQPPPVPCSISEPAFIIPCSNSVFSAPSTACPKSLPG